MGASLGTPKMGFWGISEIYWHQDRACHPCPSAICVRRHFSFRGVRQLEPTSSARGTGHMFPTRA
eukprot:8226978-Pyramimonas_sp.AAC.1